MKAPRMIARIALALVLATFAADALARNVTIVLKDGRRITGQMVSETGDDVTVKVAGIETTFPRDQIGDLQVEMTLAEQFAESRQKLKEDDYNGRYELARRMFDTKSPAGYTLALGELDSILEANPTHEMAKLLRNVVNERMKLQPDKPDQPDVPVPPVSPEDEGPAQVAPGVTAPRELTKDEINIIKVFETRLRAKPNIVVPRKVIDEVLEKYQNERVMEPFRGRDGNAKFRNLKGYEQLSVLFDLQARDYYKDVLVRTEPESLIQFGQSINRQYVIGYCGRCHGEGRAPGFYVVTRPATSENTRYTNLLLIRRTTSNSLPLAFTADPGRSPLLQFGLPRKDAGTPHPDVKGFKHHFTGVGDPRYTMIREWIGSLYGESTDYPIDFKPPAIPKAEPDAPPPAAPEPAKTPTPAPAPAPAPGASK